MAIYSYSPHGDTEPNPDYEICCRAYHATTAAKFFSCYFFILCLLISATNFLIFGFDHTWFSIFCILFTIYSLITMYGVFLEKRIFIIPFLAIQGILTIVCFFTTSAFAFFGTFTNLIYEHHRDSQLLRSLYEMHWLDPDDEKTQTIVSSLALLALLICLIISGYSWYVMWKTYKCYKANDRTICPGYQKGVIVNNAEI